MNRPASALSHLSDSLNFVLTNRVPRALLTHFMGWFSQVRTPWVRDLSIALWRRFGGLDLRDAKKSRFDSIHDCFTRELADGARPLDTDPAVLVSPCDAIVGACGPIADGQLLQAKGIVYGIDELLCDPALARRYHGGCYATLRLTAGMYHRFHAPHAGRVEHVTYLSGDTWNVNPPALARIDRLFCKNERAVVCMRLADQDRVITLVPVAAILVASLRLHFVDLLLHLGYRGPKAIACAAPVVKGEEMGWFQHGSTILLFAPPGFALCAGITPGTRIQMGRGLMRAAPIAQAPELSPAGR